MTHGACIFGGEGRIGKATRMRAADGAMNSLVRVAPAREGRRRSSTKWRKKTGCRCRISFSNNFERQISGPRLPQLGDDLARSR